MAFSEYSADSEAVVEFGIGKRYLLMYGLLQALYLQQDAVQDVCRALHLTGDLEDYGAEVREVRDTRNDAVGHPTSRRGAGSRSYHFISRMTLTEAGFDLHSAYADGRSHTKHVTVSDLIATQQRANAHLLRNALDELQRRDEVHKDEFRREKLVSAFPPHLGYVFEKVFEGTRRADAFEQGKAMLPEIRKALETFRSMLENRGVGLGANPGIEPAYEELEYPLRELDQFFDSQPNLTSQAAEIFVFFLRAKLQELAEMAREIDEEYST